MPTRCVDAVQLTEQLARIADGPAGPQVGAFFDLDGTLVAGYTASTFFTDRLRHREVSLGTASRTIARALDGAYFGGEPTAGAVGGYGALRGQTEDRLVDLGERLFAQQIARTIRPQARALVHAHKQAGHTVVVASAASHFQIDPVAADLGIEHVVCTELEAVDGVLTGEIRGKLLWGPQKAAGVRAFAKSHLVDLRASYAYGNGDEDVAFLAAVGNPVALNAATGLRQAAGRFGWPVLDLENPADSGPVELGRTLLALGGLNAGAATGMAWGLLRRDRQAGLSLGVAMAKESLGLAGVSIRVTGEERLPDGPAVYVANHQSSLDPVVAAAVIPGEFTIIAKKEARFDPRSVAASLLVDPAYIDRSDSAQARATLDALVERIHGGTSLLIFPEGTRSATPTLGRFRKGGFHVAIQAQVPIVPLVLRNTGEILPRHGRVLRPGVVDVAVLDPVENLRAEDLDGGVAALRDRFTAALNDWPGA